MYGSTNAHEVLLIAFGAIAAETTTRAPVASQIGRKRAATTPLATSAAKRPPEGGAATRPECPGALTNRASRGGGRPKSVPRPGGHCVHETRGVSTVTERVPGQRTLVRVPGRGNGDARTRTPTGKTEVRARLTLQPRRVYARCTSGGARRVLLREKAVAAVAMSVTGQPRRAT